MALLERRTLYFPMPGLILPLRLIPAVSLSSRDFSCYVISGSWGSRVSRSSGMKSAGGACFAVLMLIEAVRWMRGKERL